MKTSPVLVAVVWCSLVLLPAGASAQQGDLTHQHPAVPNAAVDFGVLPTAPIGPLPCLQSGAIGGPTDPCAYKLHHLTPEEVTILKDGEVSFQVHGGGHAMAIYEVSKDTTRDQIGQYLCAGLDPGTIAMPADHPCNLSALNANASHVITDGHDDVVIVASPNITNTHPDNRVWSEPGRLMSAGGQQFLNGGTIPAGSTSNGQLRGASMGGGPSMRGRRSRGGTSTEECGFDSSSLIHTSLRVPRTGPSAAGPAPRVCRLLHRTSPYAPYTGFRVVSTGHGAPRTTCSVVDP